MSNQVYGLYFRLKSDLWVEPVMYGTNITQLRKVMAGLTQRPIKIGSYDIDNEPDMDCYSENDSFYIKIKKMPTIN